MAIANGHVHSHHIARAMLLPLGTG